MLNVVLHCLASANWTLFHFGKFIMYRATEFVSFRRAFHEPIAIDAQNVESVEAIVDPYQVNSVSEGLSFQVGL